MNSRRHTEKTWQDGRVEGWVLFMDVHHGDECPGDSGNVVGMRF